jgi:carbonic anhydrase
MKSSIKIIALIGVLLLNYLQPSFAFDDKKEKPSPDKIIQMLKEGNERFSSGNSIFPNSDSARLQLAGKEDQANYAYATILSCSDSRVPVEMLFDAGVMDLFVVRVAGNVADTDEIGTIEYGLIHVNTPVLVVLGHTKCGAVTAVTQAVNGEHHKLEYNIPPLVDNIIPAVKKAIDQHKDVHGNDIVPYAIEENVWQSIEDLFMHSTATRKLVASGTVQVVGAIYDIATGKINWLPIEKTDEILRMVEASPNKQTQEFAE